MREFILIFLIIFTILLLNGCTSCNCGANEEGSKRDRCNNEPVVYVSDFPVSTRDGQVRSFHRLREPVAVIGFVGERKDCCYVSPELGDLAEQVRDLPVTVAQVTIPTKKCRYGPEKVECGSRYPNVLKLYDPELIAWSTVNTAEAEMVYLIDEDDRIVDRVPMDRAELILGEIKAVADNAYTRKMQARRW